MMDSCWEMDPDKRATFSVLKRTLNGLLPDSQQTPPVDLDSELQQQAKGELRWWVGWGILYVVVVLVGYVTLLVYLCLSLYT